MGALRNRDHSTVWSMTGDRRPIRVSALRLADFQFFVTPKRSLIRQMPCFRFEPGRSASGKIDPGVWQVQEEAGRNSE
jgi:hypothetical protein